VFRLGLIGLSLFWLLSIVSYAGSNDVDIITNIEYRSLKKSNIYNKSIIENGFSESQYKQTYYTLIPNITLSSASVFGDESSVISSILEVNFNAGYNLVDLAFLPLTVRAASYKKDLVSLTYLDQINDFRGKFRVAVLDLAEKYYDFLNRKEVLGLEKEEFEKSSSKFKLGAQSKLDYLRSKSSFERNRNNLAEIKSNFELSKKSLGVQFKIDNVVLVELLQILKKHHSRNRAVTGSEKLIIFAESHISGLKNVDLKRTLTLRGSEAEMLSLEYSKTASLKNYLPNVSLFAAGDTKADSINYGLRLSLSFPAIIKDTQHFALTKKNYLTSFYNHNQEQISQNSTKNKLISSLRKLKRTYEFTLDNLKIRNQIYNLSKEGYQKGQVTSRAYIDDLADYVEATSAVLKAKYQLLAAISQKEVFENKVTVFTYLYM
jgi:outer membrane protein TolC